MFQVVSTTIQTRVIVHTETDGTMDRRQTPGTPRRNRTPQPHTPQARRSSTGFPFSSPYSGKSPLPMPILNHSQYISEGDVSTDRVIGSERIEIFEKYVGKPDIVIPEVGCSLETMPFFDDVKSKQFTTQIQRINNQMTRLNKTNNSIVEMNESLGAYLFGLYQNAWCVNMNENYSLDRVEKLEKVKSLEDEIKELEAKLENAKRRKSLLRRQELQVLERRKSTMPPPSIPRFNNRNSRVNKRARDTDFDNDDAKRSDVASNKRTFLRAGSRAPLYQVRNDRSQNIPRRKAPTNTTSGLNISYATKMRTMDNSIDTSNDSSGDTSEVQTLNTIRRLSARNAPRPRRGSSLPREQQSNVRKSNSWEVNHRKPFR